MKLRQISSPKIFLAAILSLFAIKGVFLGILIPLFQNPDEQIHYATVQHWAEPEEKTWEIAHDAKYDVKAEDISTYHLTEETIRTAIGAQFDDVKFQRQNAQKFSENDDTGPNESGMVTDRWKRFVEFERDNISGTKSAYYLIGSWIEQWLSDSSVLVRFHAIRLLSVLFGLGVALLAYLIARKIGFSEHVSLLSAALVAFQPMFSITAAQANIDIALIFSFSLFLFAGVSFLKYADSSTRGLARNDKEGDAAKWTGFFATLRMTDEWLGMTKWAALAIFAAMLGVLSKGPGIVLVAALYPLFAYGIYAKMTAGISRQARNDKKKRFFIMLAVATVALAGIAFLAAPKGYLAGITNFNAHSKFETPIESIGKYLDKTLREGELRDTALSYWGHFGWLDTPIPGWALSTINWIEIVGFGAVLVYLFFSVIPAKAGIQRLLSSWIPDQVRDDKAGWMPERKHLLFFLGMILALQFAIRFYDWRVFDAHGKVLIGQPGRYFLPNIIGHLVIVSVGLGLAVSWIKERISKIPAYAGTTKEVRSLDCARDDRMEAGSDSEKDFEMILKILALAMILLQLHAIVNVIVPRYYL